MELALSTGKSLVNPAMTDDLQKVMSSGDYLPRFQVCGSNTKVVQAGIVPQNVFAIQYNKDKATNLGKEVDILLITVRGKALDTNDPVTEYFDQSSQGFLDTKRKAGIKDSGCMFGPEFLIWVPNEGENGTFCTWFQGSKTGRREGPGMTALMKKEDEPWKIAQATVGIRMITQGKFTWPGSTCKECLTAFAMLPDQEELDEQVEKFNSPPTAKVEKVADNAAPQRAV